ILILRAFRHRKEPDGISAKQDFGCNFKRLSGTAHASRLNFAARSVKRSCESGRGRWHVGLTIAWSGLLSEKVSNRKEIPDDGVDDQRKSMVSTTNEIIGFKRKYRFQHRAPLGHRPRHHCALAQRRRQSRWRLAVQFRRSDQRLRKQPARKPSIICVSMLPKRRPMRS